MNHCPKCCTRFDACAECKDAEIAKVDRASKWLMKEHAKECCEYEAEIAALKAQIEKMKCCENCRLALEICPEYICGIRCKNWEPQQ